MSKSLMTISNNALLSGDAAIRLAAEMKQNITEESAAAGGSGTQFIKFDGNTGAFTFGKNNEALDPAQVFIIPIVTLKQGWIYWASQKPEKDTQVFDFANRPFPKKPDNRPETGHYANVKGKERDGWQRSWEVEMTGYEGELEGIGLTFPGTSTAYQHFWSAIRDAFIEHMEKGHYGNNPAAVNPMLTIAVGDYFHKGFNRTIFFLTPEIIGWTDGFEIVPVVRKATPVTAEKAEELDPLS